MRIMPTEGGLHADGALRANTGNMIIGHVGGEKVT